MDPAGAVMGRDEVFGKAETGIWEIVAVHGHWG